MSAAGKWDDLGVRLASGIVLIVVGTAAMVVGGVWFLALTTLASGLMIWELARMVSPDAPGFSWTAGGLAAISLVVALSVPAPFAFLVIAIPAAFGAVQLREHKLVFVVYAYLILLASYGLVNFRDTWGVLWLLWLVLIVVLTDVLGYFAGRFFGGPKFWPSISPKKTWSGTSAGWLGALCVGYYFWTITDAGRDLLWISMLLSFASQMGDIAESAVKRKMGVKDSSNLIPGHGGLFDRFDGLLGASLYMLIVARFVEIPVLV